MKYLVLLLVIAAVVWVMRSAGRRLPPRDSRRRPPPPPTEDRLMVACAECGLHLPRGEALLGQDGQTTFCSEAHRRAHERGHPPL